MNRMLPETMKALAAITDEGLFERIATAVLREAHPLCAAVCHVGITIDGKTKKSPLDGIAIVNDADGQRLVAVHHTTTALESLKRKWLHDPGAVRSMKAKDTSTPSSHNKSERRHTRASSTPAGDLIKTAAIVAEERKRTPGLRATLVLTTTQEPDEELFRDVKATGIAHQIDVDVWSRSRIAHFLDTRPTGHSIRRMLGIESELLSAELLSGLSRKSLESIKPPDDSDWVPRALDSTLARLRQPTTILVAESGMGKTVACYRLLQAHVIAGGYALVLRHELLEASPGLERAIELALQELHPTLRDGQTPFAYCTPERPLYILLEDVNLSGQPNRILQKLAAWTLRGVSSEATAHSLRVFCPIWARTLGVLDEQTRKAVEPFIVFPEPMTPQECRAAVIARTRRVGFPVSEVVADGISAGLGHDPLLIALYDYRTSPSAHTVIGSFIERGLMRVQETTNQLAQHLHGALLALAEQMLRRRRLDLEWHEIAEWGFSERITECLRSVAQRREIVRLVGPLTHTRLAFRHDRVRDWLLVEAALQMEERGFLDDDLTVDPFFADILGAMLVRRGSPPSLIARLRRQTPLALFHALRVLGASTAPERSLIRTSIAEWLSEPATSSGANNHIRWHALAALELTDNVDVPELVKLFPDRSSRGLLAALHNGDVDAGIEICARYEFDSRAPFRDLQITHAKLRFGARFVSGVASRLEGAKLPSRSRRGLLELAGHLADPTLVEALETCWRLDPAREECLQAYFWAFARCSDASSAARNLAPICDLWSALPTSDEKSEYTSPKTEFGAELAHGFEQNPPSKASLQFLVARAQDADLGSNLTDILSYIDDPIALVLVLERAEARLREPNNPMVNTDDVRGTWRRDRRNRTMSAVSRTFLLQQWRNTANDRARRTVAFRLWSSTIDEDDIRILREVHGDADLGDRVLVQRLVRGDRASVPDLIVQLRDVERGHLWWPHAQHVWSQELCAELDRGSKVRAERYAKNHDGTYEIDREIRELLIRIPQFDAEQILVNHWEHLQFSRRFVQVALYIATTETVRLAAERLAKAADPAALLQFISNTYGVRWVGHPGVTREVQVLVLEPYVDLLRQSDREKLAEVCNEAGWYETRRRLFERYLRHRYHSWSVQDPREGFDELVTRGSHWIDLEIERALATGVTWDQFLRALSGWLSERRSLKALDLVARAVVERGGRGDIGALEIFPEMDRAAASAIVADASFAVRRRTLR